MSLLWRRLDCVILLLRIFKWLPVTTGIKVKALTMTVKTSSIPSATISPPATTLSRPNNLRILNPPSAILPQSLCIFALPGMAFLAKAAGLAPSVGLGSMSPPQRALPQLRFIKWPTLLLSSYLALSSLPQILCICLLSASTQLEDP